MPTTISHRMPSASEAKLSRTALAHTAAQQKNEAFLNVKAREISQEAQVSRVMGLGHYNPSSSMPTNSDSTKASARTLRYSPPQPVLLQQDSSFVVFQDDKPVAQVHDPKLFGRKARTLPARANRWVDSLYTSLPVLTSSLEPEKFYRSAIVTGEGVQSPAVIQRPLTLYPRLPTSRRFATVPVIASERPTAIDNQVPSGPEDPPPRLLFVTSSPGPGEFYRSVVGYEEEIQPSAAIQRPLTPYPGLSTSRLYATTPFAAIERRAATSDPVLPALNISSARRKRRREVRLHAPRLPADYCAETPFSFQHSPTTTPFVGMPDNGRSITLFNRHYHGTRVGGVELELQSLQQAHAPGKVLRRPLWPEQRKEIQDEVQGIAVSLAKGAGVVRDEEKEREELEVQEGKNKNKFGWLKKWLKKKERKDDVG